MNKWIIILLATILTACQQEVKNAIKVDEMPPIYPDYIDVTIPAGIAPLNFDSEEEADCMDVVVKGSQGGELHVQGDYASFEVDDWHQLVQANQGGTLTFSVCIQQEGQWYRYKNFQMQISRHALPDYGLTYRRIAPGYEVYSHMGLYERELASFEERAIIENTQVPGMCVNCDSVPQYPL